MRELFLQIVYGRTQTAFSEGGLPIGACLEDLGKGLRSMTGTIFSTRAKGVRYLELTEGYIMQVALDENNEAIGYKFVRLAKCWKTSVTAKTPKRLSRRMLAPMAVSDGAAKYIDPREE